MMSTALGLACVRVCVHIHVRTCRRGLPGNQWTCVDGNKCSLGSDGWLRTSAYPDYRELEGQERRHLAAGPKPEQTSRRNVSSPRIATKVKLVLKEPSGTGVCQRGLGLCIHNVLRYGKLTHKGQFCVYDNTINPLAATDANWRHENCWWCHFLGNWKGVNGTSQALGSLWSTPTRSREGHMPCF